MARGGYGQGSGVPLHARTRAGSPPGSQRQPDSQREADPPAEPDACPARHCWVSAPVDGNAPRPALLLEWRQVERGRWEGRVAYAALLRPGRWATVEEWLPAELLTGPD